MTTDVVLVIDSLEVGGAQRQLAVLARALADEGYAVAVIQLWPARVPVADLTAVTGVRHLRLFQGRAATWPGRLIQLILAPLVLRRRLVRLRPARVYSMLHLPNLLAWCATRGGLADRLVWGYRQSEMALNWKRRLLVACQRWVSPSVPMLIANSQAGATAARTRLGLRVRRIAVVPNGIDTDVFRPGDVGAPALRRTVGAAPGAPLVGLVGRIDPMKGHETFLAAAASIAALRPDVRFMCVGEGPAGSTTRLKQLSQTHKMAERVAWLPARDDMPAVYAAIDLLVLPSRDGEGFSNVVAEAMACGTPCVVTDIGDSAKIVGDTGAVVAPDDPDALATAILRLLRTSPAAGRKARARIVECYSVGRLASNTVRALDLGLPAMARGRPGGRANQVE